MESSNGLNCKNLSKTIHKISDLKERYDHFFESGDFKTATYMKWEITEVLNGVEKLLDPTNIFLSEIKKESFWDEVIDKHFSKKFTTLSVAHPNDALRVFRKLENAVAKFPKFKGLNGSVSYKNFLTELSIASFAHMELGQIFMKKKVFDTRGVCAMLNTCFLNKYLSPDQQIIVEDLPESLMDHFGCFLKKGDLVVHEAGQYLGQYMSGGKIIAGKATEEAGNRMSGGTLKILHLVDSSPGTLNGRPAGYKMSGGTLSVEQSDYSTSMGNIAEEASGGTVIAPELAGFEAKGLFTVLATKDPHPFDKSDRRFFFNPETNRYLSSKTWAGNRINGSQEEKVILDDRQLQKYHQSKKLGVISDFSNFRTNPTKNMDGGILVYRDVPKSEIGKGMKNGVIIIENDNISIEDAKKRLSKDRPGGVVLMRVWDKPGGESRLIDLERPRKEA